MAGLSESQFMQLWKDAKLPVDEPGDHDPIRVTLAVWRQWLGAVGSKEPEAGIILGGGESDDVVRHVIYDDTATCSGTTYTPDHERLGRLLREWWGPSQIRLKGVLHSHPGGCSHPSQGDLEYAKVFLQANDHLKRFLLPIMTVTPEPTVHPYVIVRSRRGVRAIRVELEILDEVLAARGYETAATTLAPPSPRLTRQETFQRVVGAYDQQLLTHTRLFVVGTGGSIGSILDFARAGISDFVLVDPDEVGTSNLATQGVFRRYLGWPKVEATAQMVRDINPHANVRTAHCSLDELHDATIAELLGLEETRPPFRSVLCGFSDSHPCQARINRLALHLGLPSLCAQVYREGRGAEITFTHPLTTPACHRCILRTRYEAYAIGDVGSPVTSDGTPIFTTSAVNALKGYVLMALIHHGTTQKRWGGMLERIGNRNLIQVRLDPDLDFPVFGRVFSADPQRVFLGEPVWLPQHPEGPATGRAPCRDCGGTGDLRTAFGAFSDTRRPDRLGGE